MSAATGTDWTRILSDPDLVRHVGKLLQAYREAPAEKREEALLAAMREIKAGGLTSGKSASASKPAPAPSSDSNTDSCFRDASVRTRFVQSELG